MAAVPAWRDSLLTAPSQPATCFGAGKVPKTGRAYERKPQPSLFRCRARKGYRFGRISGRSNRSELFGAAATWRIGHEPEPPRLPALYRIMLILPIKFWDSARGLYHHPVRLSGGAGVGVGNDGGKRIDSTNADGFDYGAA